MKKYGLVLCMLSAGLSQAATDDQRLAAETLGYINQYRIQHGLPQLVMDPVLSREAAKHSQAMASHALPFGHDGFSQRIQHLHAAIPQSSSGAENVAYNYKTAKIVVDGWIHSPGHRQNIVGHYNLTGIGIARDSQNRPYYTQLFLRTDRQLAQRTTHHHPFVWLHRYHRHG